jgi:hypothetical protein
MSNTQIFKGALIDPGSYECVVVRESEVSEFVGLSDYEALAVIADEFIAYYTQRDGCSNCGGLPHSATCFVRRFQQLRGEKVK